MKDSWTDKPPEVAGDRSVSPIRRAEATREAVEKVVGQTLECVLAAMDRTETVAEFSNADIARNVLSDPAIRALYEEEG